jgi:carbon monoxide dehydrogenase subunit G
MASVVAEVELPATAEKVWSVLSDPHRFDEWLTIHAGWIGEVPGEFAPGTKMSEKVVLLGMANKVDWTVETVTAPSADVPGVFKMSGIGMAGVTVGMTISVSPAGPASNASIESEFAGAMVVGALGKAVEKEARKNLDESMAKLISLLT